MLVLKEMVLKLFSTCFVARALLVLHLLKGNFVLMDSFIVRTCITPCFEPLGFRARHVYGYEVVPQAIKDACLNAELNSICNATFVQGDLNKIDQNFGNNFPKPDIIISGQTLHFPLVIIVIFVSSRDPLLWT